MTAERIKDLQARRNQLEVQLSRLGPALQDSEPTRRERTTLQQALADIQAQMDRLRL